MKKVMHRLTIVFAVITIISIILYKYTDSVFVYSLGVTFFTFLYHFVMRLMVGLFCDKFVRPNPESKWFSQRTFEKKLYKFLKVKKWKEYVPTYYPEAFDIEKNSPEKLEQSMCGAEIVHEIIMILSFIPLLFAISFGVFPVFFTTSVFASLVDSVFVIVQRYNRPRIIKLIRHKNNSCKN